jgi:Ras-related protein Rab-43
MDSDVVEKVYKVLIAGDGGIGKTTLLKLFCTGTYIENQRLTVGMGVFIKTAEVKSTRVSLQMWDFGGQNQFRFMLDTFISGASGAILGFELKRRKSFLGLPKWIKLLRSDNPKLPIVLIGTKKDLGYHPALNSSMVDNFAEENDFFKFVETSAKLNYQVELPFKVLLGNINDWHSQDVKFLSLRNGII